MTEKTEGKHIVIIEDEKSIQNLLKIMFKGDTYKIAVLGSGQEGIDYCVKNIVDLMLLDLGLPDMDGLRVVETVRGFSEIPIIIVSARSDADEKVRCLDAGANDYLEKPFSSAELLARVRVWLRTAVSAQAEESVFTNGGLKIDFAAHSVFLDNGEIHLTNYEYKILCLLAQNVGKTLTHTYMISKIWGAGGNDAGGLRVFMAGIRRKIEKTLYSQDIIRTDVGVGYRMNKI